MNKKLFKFILKLLISTGLVVLIIVKINWQEVWVTLANARVEIIFLYVIVSFLGLSVSAYKWKLLCQYKKFPLSFREAFKLYLSGALVNNFMPSFIGGDAYRAYQIGKKSKKYSQAATTVIADRLSGLLSVMILTFVFFIFNFQAISCQKVLFFLNIVNFLGLAIIFILFIFGPQIRKLMNKNIKNANKSFWAENSLLDKISKFANQLTDYVQDKNFLGKITIWSLIFGLVGVAGVNYIMFLALGLEISLVNFLSVIFLISVVSAIPVSINNIGVKEWAYIVFFGFWGLTSGPVVAAVLLGRFLQMLISLLAISFYLKDKN